MSRLMRERLGFDKQNVEQNSALLRLPHELMDMVLDRLDFAPLVNLAATSRQASYAVRSMPIYRELPLRAPDAMEMLVKTDMLGQWEAADIRRAFQSRNCANCQGRGVLLYLPTCQRMCLDCVTRYDAYTILDEPSICKYLFLEPSHLKGLPRFRNPGEAMSRLRRRLGPTKHETIEYESTVRPGTELISFEQAMEVALDVHGCDREHRQLFCEHATGPCIETPESPAAEIMASWCPPRPIDWWEESHHRGPKTRPYINLRDKRFYGFRSNSHGGLWAAAKFPCIDANGEAEPGISDIIILRNCLKKDKIARLANAKRVKPTPPPRRPWRERHPLLSAFIFGP